MAFFHELSSESQLSAGLAAPVALFCTLLTGQGCFTAAKKQHVFH